MSFEQFKAYLERVPVIVEIWFAGMCESWLNPECTRMVLHAHGKGHPICVFSTLVGMQCGDVKAFEHIRFGFFRVHLPSVTGAERISATELYLDTLSALIASPVNATFHCHDGALQPQVAEVLQRTGQSVRRGLTYRRSGNLKHMRPVVLPRRRGRIACKRGLRNNVLLPNGDVLLCSNDYAHKHILGNLGDTDYEALASGVEFKRILAGQKDDTMDILCRYCEEFCVNGNRYAGFANWRYLVNNAGVDLKNLRSVSDCRRFGRRVSGKLWHMLKSPKL